ncbi:2-C-methyl-D-erythritol 4-phosphate cytidylyltransferase [Mycoplasma sp. P36-A1]|uniref:2-C-methyl-D-erythritol 4-phosphate cytidylyltransferase n=1 Tax=Mycoplasma sp. P36-A1 TaxID=3252900 RepID=UPI003C2E54DA
MISVIISAAGSGSRMKLGYNKMFYKIGDETIIEKTVNIFSKSKYIDNIIVVANADEITLMETILSNYNVTIVKGANERYASIYNGLKKAKSEYVLIHDGARCFITLDLIERIAKATIKYKAAFLGVLSKDTIHLIDKDNNVNTTLNRNCLVNAQTPQGFLTKDIKQCYQKMYDTNNYDNITDDVMVAVTYGNIKPKYIESEYYNIKVTTIEDL